MKLKELRKSHGMGQQDVADALGIPITTYRKYENETRQAPLEVLISLADHYKVSLDYLMGRDLTPDEMRKVQLDSLYGILDEDGRELLVTLARMIVKSGDYLSI